MSFNGNGRFNNWVSSGKLITAGWFITLIVYCTFRARGIEDPMIGNVFFAITGGWVGWLTLVQGRKNAKDESRADRAEAKVERLERENEAKDGELNG
jgi:hypothetical protein